LILLLISLAIGGDEIDSLKNLVHPLLVKRRAELLNENPLIRTMDMVMVEVNLVMIT
jgi:hypothetical protein